jgi:hypothetical protein
MTERNSRYLEVTEVGQTDASCGRRQVAEVKTTSARKPKAFDAFDAPTSATYYGTWLARNSTGSLDL